MRFITAATIILLYFSRTDAQKLKLVGKWTAVNTKLDEQVVVMCEARETQLQPVWILSEHQKTNNRIEIVRNVTNLNALLIVRPNLTASDEQDPYTCALIDQVNNKTIEEAKFDLQLYNASRDSTLNVSEPEIPEFAHENSNVRWTISVSATEDFLIEPDSLAPSKHDVSCTKKLAMSYLCKITMKNVSGIDLSYYDFVAYNRLVAKKFRIFVMVLPEIQYTIVSMMPQVYTPGLLTSPICMPDNAVTDAAGELIRKNMVRWEYYECDDLAKCDNKKQVPIDQLSEGTAEEDQGALTYTLKNFSPKKSGVLKCEGVDSKGRWVSATQTVCMSDGPLVLTKNKTGNLEKGSTATLYCEFSTCNYEKSSGIRWFHTSKQVVEGMEQDLEEITANVTSAVMGNNYRSRVHIQKLSPGTYICKGKPLGTYPKLETFIVQL